jgi:hypothetical protein
MFTKGGVDHWVFERDFDYIRKASNGSVVAKNSQANNGMEAEL